MTHPTPVFYTPAMSATTASYSPSSGKPALVVQDWQQHWDIAILEPRQATLNELKLAHDPDYVDGVLACTLPNGFRNHDPAVAATLPWTVGAMLSAAEWAVERYGTACAPVSGFHHAHWDRGGGFCTFNGLMIAALALRAEGLVKKVAVLDCDEHYGNGTDDIIERLGLETFIRHVTAGRGYPRNRRAFLNVLPDIVAGFADCDLILYQAGADPHIDDPLGGWLSTEELYERDRRVFAAARRHALPVAWNLAGGYQRPIEKVLEIHDNTLRACIAEHLSAEAMVPTTYTGPAKN